MRCGKGSIEARVNVLVVTAALAVGGVGGTGWASVAALRVDTARLFDAQTVLSAQQQADMLHDEVRGDVLGALLHPEGDAGVRALRNTEELREQAAAERAPLSRLGVSSLVQEHDEAVAALERYTAAAEQVVRLADTDPAAAQALLPAFELEFLHARDRMAVVTDHLRGQTDAVRDALVTRAASQHWRTGAVVGVALALLAALALGIRRSIRAALAAKRSVEDEVRRANLRLRGDADDKRFQSTLKDAFDMALGEDEAGEVVRRAARELVPDRRVELLMADNSRAHLSAVMVEPVGAAAGCSVASPGDCVAVRRGRPLRFGDPEQLGSCPRLRGRGTAIGSAVCAPVTFLGEGLGVLHVVSGEPDLRAVDEDGLRHLAEEAGNRIGTLRAFNRSQLQASTDGLTGLLNRRSAEERVRELQRAGHSLAVVLADLDHFKAVNDTFGHEAGDRALRIFSSTLRSVLRADDVVARYGGEEFLLVLPDCAEARAHDVLQRVRSELALTVVGAGVPAFTASFGLTVAAAAEPLEEVVRRADVALMQAKTDGRDRVVVSAGPQPVPAGKP